MGAAQAENMPISELSFFLSPKAVKVPGYRDRYLALKKILGRSRLGYRAKH
jgi:hypothetical protein